ncbi:MAG TPA: hypothetical protein VGQ36_09785 [Thermoanaerobaculia bacterium]|jgi:hypothetical protein|nr:hypothetical protein [Thermoanaerobaculia bacterium]
MAYGKDGDGINLDNTAKAFDVAYGHPDALKKLAGAVDQFYKTIGVQLNGAEQKYVLSYLVTMSPSGNLFDPASRPMIQSAVAGRVVAVQ